MLSSYKDWSFWVMHVFCSGGQNVTPTEIPSCQMMNKDWFLTSIFHMEGSVRN